MTRTPQPASGHDALSAAAGAWHERWQGRPLFRAVAGPGWLRLHLVGDERPALVLVHEPGAVLALAGEGPLPEALHRDLKPSPRHPLSELLANSELAGIGVLPADRVLALEWDHPQRGRLVLFQQLFGPRGNLVLLDEGKKLLWAAHRPPHPLLMDPPGKLLRPRPAQSGLASDGFARDTYSAAALERWIEARCEQQRRTLEAHLRRRAKTADRLVANLNRDHERAERGDEYRRCAETLAVHLHTLESGMQQARLTDPRTGQELEIALDPRLSPAANLESWFRRARKAEKGCQVIRRRLDEAEKDASRAATALDSLGEALAASTSPQERLGALRTWKEENRDLLPTARARRRSSGPEEPARPFRRYRIDGRWEVWIGRNNQENDALTFGASHGKDLWLHAQGVPGSHVILRTGGHPERVPRTVLQKTAALAALHCRSKHSSLVPVIWTERRYVRKPRKAPAGAATCLREKSVFVEPGVAPGVVAE